ncbi:MAG: 50S ribosomal protein L25 [Bacteroidales bacterium]|nr:50S ribosomal protein L25 [Bacteroidales bacterium]MDD2425111.1 50S ribosomal protein L25 [Bacteroidales bacterium]MDD3988614.1 50S ribosomal protein L25 [Bacteroidales bacterium]MDD4639671.1 50S ribosomal protein L25 [Bacteroidales bacterium]
MKTFKLKGEPRKVSNKQAVKTLRRNAGVPCILYGKGIDNLLFSVNAKELKQITDTPNSYIIELEVEGKTYMSIFHMAQYHPVTDEPLHIDFIAVSEDKPINIDVPVFITGNSEGVRQGGKMTQSVRKLRISALMKDLPDSLTIDITDLKLGKTITAGDLKYDNIQILTPKSTIICSVKMTRAAIGAAAAESTEK